MANSKHVLFFSDNGMLVGDDGSIYNIKSIDRNIRRDPCSRHYVGQEIVITATPVEQGDGTHLGRFPKIKRVILSGPATIVFWDDGVKTVAKCSDDDEQDIVRGIELCMMKRLCGNSYGGYLDEIASALSVAEVEKAGA